MILQKLCELSVNEELLQNPDYQPKGVAWILAIADGGKFLDAIPTATAEPSGKRARPKTLSIPRREVRKSAPLADFLVDKSEYVLGAEPNGKRSQQDLDERMALFRQKVSAALEKTSLPALRALEAFLCNSEEREAALKRVTEAKYASHDLFAFQYNGELIHEIPLIKAYFSKMRNAVRRKGGQCIVCGITGPTVDKHPPVQIPGGTTSGIALVSFNKPAFESYGLERNDNAPVCRHCADAYTTALTRLLSERYPDPRTPGVNLPKRFIRLAPNTTAVFWADDDSDILDLLHNIDAPDVASIGRLFAAPHAGSLPCGLSNRFYCLILSGGEGRAVLRGMHTGTVAVLEQTLRTYFASIGANEGVTLPLWRLLAGIVLPGKRGPLENLPPSLAGDVFSAILFNKPYPRTLFARAVERCRLEQMVTRERAALLRSFLIRNLKWETTMGLDRDSMRPGYRLGRLMAVLERIQGAAQRNLNKTIVDRYYGAASTRPGTVFPQLLALAPHHLAKLETGLAVSFNRLVAEVLEGIAEFPPVLKLEDQGLFALGYYHQRQEISRGKPTGNTEEA